MYAYLSNGKKLKVDTSGLKEGEVWHRENKVTLVSDDCYLEKVWIMALNRYKQNGEWEFVKEIKYEHEPKKEDIIYQMSANGLSWQDYIMVNEAWVMKWDD